MGDAKSINILLIDDDEEELVVTKEIISEITHQPYTIAWVSTYEKALLEIKNNIYDVYLVDYNLGAKTGLDLIDEAKKMEIDTPFIVLTELDNREVDLLAMKKGASDFLRKGKIDAELLERAIRYAIENKKTAQQILHLAYYDQITNLPNRYFFKEKLNYSITQALRYNRIIAILYLDLDNFKLINDSLGHYLGDMYLKAVAQRLYESIRKSDIITRSDINTSINTVARLGGDEFTISLTELNACDDASLAAERILRSLNEPITIEGHEIFTSASIGIALCPLDATDADTLLKYADNAMYYAKSQGKNCFQYYQKTMNDQAANKMYMIQNIRKAVSRGEFLLHYQPKMEIKSGRLIGFEALIRWNNADGKLIPPMEFIPFAETHHLIGHITEWVFHEVCRQLHEWSKACWLSLPVSLNLPVSQFRRPDFVNELKKAMAACGLLPQMLELEVTESIFMEDIHITNTKLNELHAAGFQISIDDFGTGFSSLNRLLEVPCNILKIDKSFIQSIGRNPMDIIVNSIISMGHGLNMKIIAEGVENREQYDFLSRNNCDCMQGYLLSRPLPAEQIPGILQGESQGAGIGVQLVNKIKNDTQGK